MTAPNRLLPDIPLPPYTYVPGQQPHPFSDPRGHRFGGELPPSEPVTDDNWRASLPYLLGLDLFNGGYYWESHEQWESLWHAAGRQGPTADFLKGLIKLAAAGVKNLEGRPDGVKGHAARAAELLRAGQIETFLGLHVKDLIELAETIQRDGWPNVDPRLWPQE